MRSGPPAGIGGNGDARRTMAKVARSMAELPDERTNLTPERPPEREMVKLTTVRPRWPPPGLRL